MLIDKMTRKERNKLAISLMETSPLIINDHTNELEEITGLVEFNNPNKDLACCFKAQYYSLNACEININGQLHCSEISIGGILWGAYPDSEQLKKYNDNCVLNSFKIKCIHRPDGTKVYPANDIEEMNDDELLKTYEAENEVDISNERRIIAEMLPGNIRADYLYDTKGRLVNTIYTQL